MKKSSLAEYNLSPEIISEQDHRTLLMLAMAGIGHTADEADELLYELERAMVVADNFVPPDVVRMGSLATFRASNDTRAVQVVFP